MNLADIFKQNVGTFEFDPQIVHHFSDGLYAKQFFIPKGFAVCEHKHLYSHLSILAKGSVILKTDEKEIELNAPFCIEILKEQHHAIVALEDCVWFCIHSTDEKDPSKVDQQVIKGE